MLLYTLIFNIVVIYVEIVGIIRRVVYFFKRKTNHPQQIRSPPPLLPPPSTIVDAAAASRKNITNKLILFEELFDRISERISERIESQTIPALEKEALLASLHQTREGLGLDYLIYLVDRHDPG